MTTDPSNADLKFVPVQASYRFPPLELDPQQLLEALRRPSAVLSVKMQMMLSLIATLLLAGLPKYQSQSPATRSRASSSEQPLFSTHRQCPESLITSFSHRHANHRRGSLPCSMYLANCSCVHC